MIWPLSARTPAALAAAAARLGTARPADPAATGYSLATTRTAHRHRAVITAADPAARAAALAALAAGQPAPGLYQATAPAGQGRAVFASPARAAQHPGMTTAPGHRLAPSSPTALDQACAAARTR